MFFLHLGAVKSGTYVYVNGQKVGYTEDSKSGAEFLLNRYIKDGKNTIALEIYRWSTGSYLECQDYWRISGIERDVYIYSQPKTRLEDFYVGQTLDPTYTDGLFKLDMCMVNNLNKQSGPMEVWFELENSAGVVVEQSYKEIDMAPLSRDTVRFAKTLKNVKRWDAENPYLYKLAMRIKKDGLHTEFISQMVGFRTSEVVGNQYLVNGKRVYIKGVNIHETHPITGHVVDEATIIEDMKLMKQMNINAIRLSHYPQQRRFYELADKYGFYLCNEANIESHGMSYDLRKGGSLGNNPNWLNAHMDRTQNMYHQTKNYASVMFWSLGNEAGNGYNFYKTYLWLKSVDMTRPVQYERALLEWNTDIFCPQYPGASTLKGWGEMKTDRPYIASEYAHAMGNSTGNLREQWETIYRYSNLQGGFIWDWVDQGFLEQDAEGVPFWTYGGDYGVNSPSDGNFNDNGLLSPDRTPHPGAVEVKKAYQYILFYPVEGGTGSFEVRNIYDFTNTDKYLIKYYLKANDKTIGEGTFPLALKPDQIAQVYVPMNKIVDAAGIEYFVNFEATLKADDGLLKKGAVVASDQYRLRHAAEKRQYSAKGEILVSQEGSAIGVKGKGFELAIDKTTGNLYSYKVNSQEMIADQFGLRPNFWRAMTDNDFGSQLQTYMLPWREPSKSLKAKSVTSANGDDNTIRVETKYALPEDCVLTITYKIYPTGIVNIGYQFIGNKESKAQMIRHGVRLRLPKEMETLEYFGRGPEENYCDRNWGTNVGLYRSTASAQYFNYVRPQENGHHTDTRYLALTRGAKGAGLLIEANKTMEFNALRNSIEDFDAEDAVDKPYQWSNFVPNENHDPERAKWKKAKQTHINNIKPREYVELCLDQKMMGLGGDNSWRARPYPDHMIEASQDVTWGFTLIPIKNVAEIPTLIGKKY